MENHSIIYIAQSAAVTNFFLLYKGWLFEQIHKKVVSPLFINKNFIGLVHNFELSYVFKN